MNSAALIVDDHVLLRILLGREPRDLRPGRSMLATTGLWYHRLCRALSDRSVTGAMSRQLGQLDLLLVNKAVQQVIELPSTIQLVSLRELAWPMGQLLSAGVRLNLLSLEALAARNTSAHRFVSATSMTTLPFELPRPRVA